MKYTKVKFNAARIKRMFRGGKRVSEIALAIGYPTGHGNNRVRRFLMSEGLYAISEAHKPERTTKAKK